MKTAFKFIFAASVAVLAAVACSRQADMTTIDGTVAGCDNVNITIKGKLDTIVPVVDGKFHVEIPTDVCVLAYVNGGNFSATLIPDGTALTIVLKDTSTVVSASERISVQERYNKFTEENSVYYSEFFAKRKEIYGDSSLTPEEKDERFDEYQEPFMERYKKFNMDVFSANTDNILGIMTLDNFRYHISDDVLSEKINSLSPELQEQEYIVAAKKAVEARLETGEGKMFKDFSVETVYGLSRSIPPQPLYDTVKFSDYVGKGKYVLVDFWAPWCGPCRREMPNIKALYEKYKGDKFDVLSIAVWERREAKVTLDAVAELGMEWNQINNAGSVPGKIYGIESIPHIMIIGPDGTILKRGLYGDELAKAVEELLK